jgi:tetratricopeptide (TPR) repeat protein
MPLYNAGVIALQRGDFAGAARSFEAVLAQQPDHLESQANLGFCLLQTGRTAEALEVLSRAVERDPQNLRVLQLLAHGQLLLGQDGVAEGVLLRMIQLEPRDAWALLQLGDLADRRGDLLRARELWQRALVTADPTLAGALQQRLSSRQPTSEP